MVTLLVVQPGSLRMSGFPRLQHVETEDFHPDVIVDWGGTSYKVFLNGKRIGTEATSFQRRVASLKSLKELPRCRSAGHGCQCISL
jgi:hypothetical protein